MPANTGPFTKGEYFYAIEFGNIWRRDNGVFNRLFLDIFYVDKNSPSDPAFPNTAGGGFKLLGSLQQGKWVVTAGATSRPSLAIFERQLFHIADLQLELTGVCYC